MAKPAKPSLLDQLRKQSEELRAQDTAARQPIEAAIKDIDRRLWRAFRWLDEALGHLEVIRPAVAHQFQLANILTLDRPHFDRGFVVVPPRLVRRVRSADLRRDVLPRSGSAPFILRVNPGAASGIEERLRAATMQFQYQTEQDEKRIVRYGLFHVQPAIAASVRFQPDYARQIVDVTLAQCRSLRIGAARVRAGQLDEAALEDLVKFMLGEENGFLRRAPLALIKPRREDCPSAQDRGLSGCRCRARD